MLQIQNATLKEIKSDRILLDHFQLSVQAGDHIAIIGEEGNGKSTLLKWIQDPKLVETYIAAEGNVICDGTLRRLPQQLEAADEAKTVYDYLSEEDAFLEGGKPLVGALLLTGLTYELVYRMQSMRSLSGGERVKVQLLRILLANPAVVLLDEPSNDLDTATLAWLEKWIQTSPLAILFISHDETLLEACANRIVHMEFSHRKQTPHVTVVSMGYRDYMQYRQNAIAKQTQLALADQREAKIRDEKLNDIRNAVNHALNNVSRQNPHTGQLLKKKMRAVKSAEKRNAKTDANQHTLPDIEQEITFFFPNTITFPHGKKVIDTTYETLMTPDGKTLSHDVRVSVYGNQKIVITGKNGVGKTTLLKRIYQDLKERDDIQVAYMPQNYAEVLPSNQDPITFLSDGTKESKTQVGLWLGAMKFTRDEMYHDIHALSYGQMAKVLFLKMNLDKANVLLLDEPTRNFSALSAPVIRQVLCEFAGCIIAVSHDRKLIEMFPRHWELSTEGIQEK